MRIIILSILILNMLALPSHATKPCSDESYHAHLERTIEEWIDVSKWAMLVEITEINHKWIPYENCYLENKSECTQRDAGNFKSNKLNIIKGQEFSDKIELLPAYCSKTLPDKLGMYIFYGLHESKYDGYELIKETE